MTSPPYLKIVSEHIWDWDKRESEQYNDQLMSVRRTMQANPRMQRKFTCGIPRHHFLVEFGQKFKILRINIRKIHIDPMIFQTKSKTEWSSLIKVFENNFKRVETLTVKENFQLYWYGIKWDILSGIYGARSLMSNSPGSLVFKNNF